MPSLGTFEEMKAPEIKKEEMKIKRVMIKDVVKNMIEISTENIRTFMVHPSKDMQLLQSFENNFQKNIERVIVEVVNKGLFIQTMQVPLVEEENNAISAELTSSQDMTKN